MKYFKNTCDTYCRAQPAITKAVLCAFFRPKDRRRHRCCCQRWRHDIKRNDHVMIGHAVGDIGFFESAFIAAHGQMESTAATTRSRRPDLKRKLVVVGDGMLKLYSRDRFAQNVVDNNLGGCGKTCLLIVY